MQRLKIALPDELRAQLDAASAKSGRSVADEIRRRVEASFAQEALDKATRELVDRIALVPAEVEKETGAVWHKHLGAWETFHEAILSIFALLIKKPAGTTKFGERPHQSCPEDEPEFLGRWIAQKLLENPGWTNSPERLGMERAFQQIKERNLLVTKRKP